jgi:ABC-type Zn uptake system ZnuABC Zn-binding protein ZnuA
MAVTRAMRRLLRVLEIQEDQYQAALASALADLKRLEEAMAATAKRDRRGRRLVAASASTGELADRLAGLEETRTAIRHAAALTPRITEARLTAGARQREFLSKRIERRQAETLIRKTEAEDNLGAGRRAQQGLDDWFLREVRRKTAEPE